MNFLGIPQDLTRVSRVSKYIQVMLSIANISPDLLIHIAILRLFVFFHAFNDKNQPVKRRQN
jgi:hypothetical protein